MEAGSSDSDGRLRFTVLGCGSSPGVPRIGNNWGACDPDNPKNRRLRSSLLVEKSSLQGTTRVLVDTSPDLREQMLRAKVDWVDGVVYTHAHADHIHGIDDLRGFVINHHAKVNIHADAPTMKRLREAFTYCFETPPGGSYPPILNAHLIEAGVEFEIKGEGGAISILPFRQVHGDIESLGFRFGSLAYSPDISALPDESRDAVAGLDVWILDGLMYRPHPSHLSVDQACELAQSTGARQVVLTHLHTPLDYDALSDYLPENMVPAFDGMIISQSADGDGYFVEGCE